MITKENPLPISKVQIVSFEPEGNMLGKISLDRTKNTIASKIPTSRLVLIYLG